MFLDLLEIQENQLLIFLKSDKWDVISFQEKSIKDRKNIKLNFDNKIEFENKISQVFKKKKKYKYSYKLHRFLAIN